MTGAGSRIVGHGRFVASGQQDARSVNTSAISADDSGGTNGVGPLDAYTFGEVAITFGQLFGTSMRVQAMQVWPPLR